MSAGWQTGSARAITRACDAVVTGLAIFTLLANAAVLLGLSLDWLIGAASVCVAAGLGWLFWRRRRPRVDADPAACASPDAPPRDVDATTQRALLVGALVAVGVLVVTGSIAAFSACGLAVGAGGLARTWDVAPRARPAPFAPRAGAALLGLSLICALAVSVAHRGDADDSFYVNLVVAAVDRPDAPLLAGDTLHGFADVPMAMPVFRVLSYELLEAGIARVTGIPALTLVQVLIPPLVALMIPLAYARLLTLLLPGRWLAATGVVVASLLLVGDGKAGFGDFALLRLHQGKSVLLHVCLPLIAAYAIDFAQRPGLRRFALLMAAQIAGVGLSSSGLWLSPAVAGLSLLGALDWRGRSRASQSLRTLALGTLASSHAILWALLLRAETRQAFESAVHRLASLSWSGDRLIAHASELSLGDGAFASLALFSLPAAVAVAADPLFRRLGAVALLAFFGIFFNSLTAPLLANYVTGPDTYFRVFWLVPVPIYLAALLTAPLEWPLRGRFGEAPARVAATLVLTGCALVLLPATHTLSSDNGVRIARPGWKIDPEEMDVALAVARHAGVGDVVLAPVTISRWLPLLQDHPSPLMVREMYLDRLHDLLGPEELERRLVLTHLAGGEVGGERAAAMLAEAIEDYPLQVVCLGGRALARVELRRVLLDSPLEVRERGPGFEIWARRGNMGQ